MADHTAESRITLHPHPRRVRILDGDTLIADTRSAIELRECTYPRRPELKKEFPRVDLDMSQFWFRPPRRIAGSRGYPLPIVSGVAWRHEQKNDEMKLIIRRLTFDVGKVEKDIERGQFTHKRRCFLILNYPGFFYEAL